jgi:hypothetical protein
MVDSKGPGQGRPELNRKTTASGRRSNGVKIFL